MESTFLLDIVVSKRPAVLKLFPSKDEALLVRRNALLVLNLALDHIDGVGALHLEGDGLAGECFHEDLHWLCVVSAASDSFMDRCERTFQTKPNQKVKIGK
jgi:hypothetical protein